MESGFDQAASDQLTALYRQYQRDLLKIAYRMLGSVADAEDVVQEVFLAAAGQNWDAIRNARAYLARMTTNRCLNVLQSGARRKERYMGPWLPEPMPDEALASRQPEEDAVQRDRIRYAMLVLLQTLTPLERAVFVLRESLGFSYGEMADMLDRTAASCRQLYSRARRKLGQVPQNAEQPSHDDVEKAARLFIDAVETGRFQLLARQLMQDVTLTTDGGGKTRAAYKPILGKARVLAFLQGIREKGAFAGKLHPVPLNGETGLVLLRSSRHVMTVHFDTDADGQIRHIYIVLNPDKLHLLQRMRLDETTR